MQQKEGNRPYEEVEREILQTVRDRKISFIGKALTDIIDFIHQGRLKEALKNIGFCDETVLGQIEEFSTALKSTLGQSLSHEITSISLSESQKRALREKLSLELRELLKQLEEQETFYNPDYGASFQPRMFRENVDEYIIVLKRYLTLGASARSEEVLKFFRLLHSKLGDDDYFDALCEFADFDKDFIQVIHGSLDSFYSKNIDQEPAGTTDFLKERDIKDVNTQSQWVHKAIQVNGIEFFEDAVKFLEGAVVDAKLFQHRIGISTTVSKFLPIFLQCIQINPEKFFSSSKKNIVSSKF